MKQLHELVRPNIWALKPYSCARTEYSGTAASVFLDANENPYNAPLSRYPDPLQTELKRELAKLKGVEPRNIFVGNGSDEAIDLVFRIFCRPGVDNVVAIEPTYGMYQVCADVNDVEYRPVRLTEDFDVDVDAMLAACDQNTKVLFLCTPNNPTGNSLDPAGMNMLIARFGGIVVVDEAYGDFSLANSYRTQLREFPNVIVLNTMSKAWASASLRLGMAFAEPRIIDLMNKVKYPYNVNLPAQREALDVLRRRAEVRQWMLQVLQERELVVQAFAQLPCCKRVYRTDANFFLAQVTDANAIYAYLVQRGIIVRNRTNVTMCEGCLRVTIGTPAENTALIAALRQYKA